MARTPDQQANLDHWLSLYTDAGDAQALVAQAAFEALKGYGFEEHAETFAAMCVGVSWLEWLVDQFRLDAKLTEAEAVKFTTIIRAGASVWAQNARDFAAHAQGITS